jgi:hydrogen cyanide synthase HcnC
MNYDLIVIGGGLVGGAIAWGAAAKGASVALLDQGDIAFRAARGNFGLVWVQSKGAGMPAYAHWTRTSAELWPQLATAMSSAADVDVSLQQPGGLAFCLSDDEFVEREAMLHRMHNESGDIGTRMIDRAELRTMVPGIGDRVVGASFCPIDGMANPLMLLRALHASLLKLGGAYLAGRTVDAIDAAPHSFTVRCGAESHTAAKLVIAAGLGSRDLAPMVGLSMPVTPLQGQIIVTNVCGRFSTTRAIRCARPSKVR